MTQDYGPRVPKDYTSEMRQEATEKLNDENLQVLEMVDVCIHLGIGRNQGYLLARTNKLPGALRIGNQWNVSREVFKGYLKGDLSFLKDLE